MSSLLETAAKTYLRESAQMQVEDDGGHWTEGHEAWLESEASVLAARMAGTIEFYMSAEAGALPDSDREPPYKPEQPVSETAMLGLPGGGYSITVTEFPHGETQVSVSRDNHELHHWSSVED